MLPDGTGFPSPAQFMETVLACQVVDTRTTRGFSYRDGGLPTTYLWTLDAVQGFQIPKRDVPDGVKVEYPDGESVSPVDERYALPLETTPSLVETPVPYLLGKHCETLESKDALILRGLGVGPHLSLIGPEVVEIEAEKPDATNWGPGRLGGFARLAGSAMWALDTFADAPKDIGYFIQYRFHAQSGGLRRLWVREWVGSVRAGCRWRVNEGPWHRVPRDRPPTDAEPVGFWPSHVEGVVRFGWQNYGEAEIQRGENLLEIQVRAGDAAPGRFALFMDKLLFAPDYYRPKGRE